MDSRLSEKLISLYFPSNPLDKINYYLKTEEFLASRIKTEDFYYEKDVPFPELVPEIRFNKWLKEEMEESKPRVIVAVSHGCAIEFLWD